MEIGAFAVQKKTHHRPTSVHALSTQGHQQAFQLSPHKIARHRPCKHLFEGFALLAVHPANDIKNDANSHWRFCRAARF